MSELNSLHNRVVWFDIPVADLERAASFYRATLAIGVDVMEFGEMRFAVLHHDQGNGGCLVVQPTEISAMAGPLVYLNATGRIKDAVAKAVQHGGSVVETVRSIGPHGFRAVVIDSEGNRIALHSPNDD